MRFHLTIHCLHNKDGLCHVGQAVTTAGTPWLNKVRAASRPAHSMDHIWCTTGLDIMMLLCSRYTEWEPQPLQGLAFRITASRT